MHPPRKANTRLETFSNLTSNLIVTVNRSKLYFIVKVKRIKKREHQSFFVE